MRLLAAALAFGALAALIKGDQDGLRDTIGNLSTPWLLVALFAGMHTRSLPRGALLGLAATVTALLGFYVVVAVAADDGMLGQVLSHNRRWLFSGLLSGPAVGAFGAGLRRSGAEPGRAVVVVTGLLLVLEPIVIFAARVVPGWREVIHWHLAPGPYLVEAVIGLALLAWQWRRGWAVRR